MRLFRSIWCETIVTWETKCPGLSTLLVVVAAVRNLIRSRAESYFDTDTTTIGVLLSLL